MPVVRPSRSTCGANRVTGHSLKPCRSCFLVDVIFSPASNRTVYERLSSQTVAWPTPSSSSDGQRVTVRAATGSMSLAGSSDRAVGVSAGRPARDSQGRNGLNVVGRVVEQGRGRQRREAACLGKTLTLLVLLDQHEGVPESQGATMDRILLGVQTVPLEELPPREILVRQL